MALSVNENQLCEYILAMEAYIEAWESLRPHRDVNPVEQKLADLRGPMESAAAKCADSLTAYKAQ